MKKCSSEINQFELADPVGKTNKIVVLPRFGEKEAKPTPSSGIL